jgi:hypothetical protein
VLPVSHWLLVDSPSTLPAGTVPEAQISAPAPHAPDARSPADSPATAPTTESPAVATKLTSARTNRWTGVWCESSSQVVTAAAVPGTAEPTTVTDSAPVSTAAPYGGKTIAQPAKSVRDLSFTPASGYEDVPIDVVPMSTVGSELGGADAAALGVGVTEAVGVASGVAPPHATIPARPSGKNSAT